MKKLISYISASILLLFSFVVVTPAVYAAGSAKQDACTAVGSLSGDGGNDCDTSNGPTVQRLINLTLQMLSIVAGVIAVIMLMISGFNYITSAGDSTKISHAKNTLIYAIVGLVVVAFAQFIVRFALARAT